MESEELSQRLAALGSVQRLRIIASLHAEPTHVSELARRLGMSRALLYSHLNRLESAGLTAGRLETSPEGHAKKYYWVTDFSIELTPQTIHQMMKKNMKENGSWS